MKTTFDGDVCKNTMGVMVMAHGKKEGTLYITSGFSASILVVSSEEDAGGVASETWAYEREGNKSDALQR